MRRATYSLVLSIFLLLGGSCHKKEPSPADNLVGEWKWIRSIGGITGKQVLTPAPGKETIYRFTRDGQWSTCTNGVCSNPTPFTLQQEQSVLTGNEQLVLTLRQRVQLAPPDTGTHILPSRFLVREISDTLHLTQDGPDGFGEYYSRK